MILFDGWMANTVGKFVGSAIAIFIFSFLYEGLKYVRETIYLRGVKKSACKKCRASGTPTESGTPLTGNDEKRLAEYLKDKFHIIQTLLHLIQVSVSYLLMLIVMTYNVWLCLAVVLGAACGYYLFGWIRSRNSDVTEHCH